MEAALQSDDVEFNNLVALVQVVKELAINDKRKIQGSHLIAKRMTDLQNLLLEYNILYEHVEPNAPVKQGLADVRRTLIQAKITFERAKGAWFGSWYKESLRNVMDDIHMAYTKLAHVLSLTHTKFLATRLHKQIKSIVAHRPAEPAPRPRLLPPPQPAQSGIIARPQAGDGDGDSDGGGPGEPARNGMHPGEAEFLMGEHAYLGHRAPQSYTAAFRHYLNSARLGYPAAMTAVGSMLREGKGTEKDTAEAIEWYTKSALRKDLNAINQLGQMFEVGEGVEQNIVKALQLYHQAARAGHLDAMTNLAWNYENGSLDEDNYVPVDISCAMQWYTIAAKHGYAKAQNCLGYLYYIGAETGTPNYEKAIKWWSKAASRGHSASQNHLGICYESGHGVPKDEEMAKAYYTEAARAGHPSAQANLGYMLLAQGSYKAAVELLRLSAEQNCKEGLYHLAQMHHYGLYTTKDDAMAFELYSKAAELLHPYALLEVGHCYFSGRGTEKNLKLAFEAYKLASSHDVSDAENSLGIMLEEGLGTEMDMGQAAYWYKRAAGKGNADAWYNLGLAHETRKLPDGGGDFMVMAMQCYRKSDELGSAQAKIRLAQQEVKQRELQKYGDLGFGVAVR